MRREIKSIAESFKNAWNGILAVIRSERNFRIHICMIIYVVFFSLIGEVSRGDILKFMLCFGMVLAAELTNSAVELLCDVYTAEYDERIRNVKDIAAGAVLVSAIAAATVGLTVFLSHDVFWCVMDKFTAKPWILIAFLASIPISVLFIVKRGK